MNTLRIAEGVSLNLGDYHLDILSYLGCFTPNVYAFKVDIKPLSGEDKTSSPQQLGLLRVGSFEGGLNRELNLRKSLNNFGLIAQLLAEAQLESVIIDPTPKHSEAVEVFSESNEIEAEKSQELAAPLTDSEAEVISESNEIEAEKSQELVDPLTDSEAEVISESNEIEAEKSQELAAPLTDSEAEVISESNEIEAEKSNEQQENQSDESQDIREENTANSNHQSEYLEEKYFSEESRENEPSEQLLLLSHFPSQEDSLEQWLKNNPSQEDSLSLIIQLCQCCFQFSENNWSLVNLVPRLMEFKNQLKLYDLTQIFPSGSTLSNGLVGEYCAPELATNCPITPLMSSYTIGAMLYQTLHHQLPSTEQSFALQIRPIPRLYQLLKIALSLVPEERFTLSQFRQLLIETRNEIRTQKVSWITASRSTVGLSLDRLQNEDNFGVKQQQINDTETLIIGVVADGMGGMAKGEIASQIAIETVLKEAFPTSFKSPEQRNIWLMNVFQKANQAIASEVENGGTTLSMILAVNEQLMIAHVGDSRIYLLRQGKIKQLSQDHSLVASLVRSGEITEEESRHHPDRSVLIKSIGSKTPLSNGYVQNLNITINNLTLTLEDHDILLLCSDGVWDLVSPEDLKEVFANHQSDSLQKAVDATIQKVLDAGAFDNATLLVFKYYILNRLL